MGRGSALTELLGKGRGVVSCISYRAKPCKSLEGSLGLLRREHVSLELLQPSCPQEEGAKAQRRKAELITEKTKVRKRVR